MSFTFDSKSPPVINGWLVLALPEVERRYLELRRRVLELRQRLVEEEFVQHPTVKPFASLLRLLAGTVPEDPDAPEFRLEGNLGKFRRAKKHGLPPRYRLFWVFSSRLRVIIFLYLNDETTLRKEGARSDPYRVFQRMIDRGEIGADFDANLELWRRTHSSA
ncbi:MAG: type II toxin-antitoxin system YhaV family toxin [Chloroflexota bacterium]